MYRQFMEFIVEEKGNILHARVYFRERQESFDKIATAFEKGKPQLLYKLKINCVFCEWVVKRYVGKPKPRILDLLAEIIKVRQAVCTAALPSAIHQAKIFYLACQYTRLDYMDMVQDASEGLMNAIDKFEPPFLKVFGSVVVSRMKERIMDDHGQTLVKIPSKDKRILYRANLAEQKKKLSEEADITKYVQESFKGVTKDEIAQIALAANSVANIDASVNGNDDSKKVRTFQEILPDKSDSQEEVLINRDLTGHLNRGMIELTVVEKKVTVLKHGPIGV
jgi:DNA-directed RNA polymerase specialized sigma subunit